MRSSSIRLRLTLWYGGVLTATLIGCGVAFYVLLNLSLLRDIDQRLDGQFDVIRDRLREGKTLNDLLDREEEHHQPFLVEVSRPDGSALAKSEPLRSHSLSPPPSLDDLAHPVFYESDVAGLGSHRFIAATVRRGSDEWLCFVGTSLSDYHERMAELQTALMTILPLGLLAALGGGFLLAGRALSPVHRITATAQNITARNLAQRVEIKNPHDELGQLAETINGMIDRLEHAFDAMRQFTADASHELLTPLTAIRTEVEVALRAERPPEQYRRVLNSVLEEVERMSKLADNLLFLSREDAGVVRAPTDLVRIDALVKEVAEHMTALAAESGIRLTIAALPFVTVQGGADSLRQVFFNLIDNAVKYTPVGGSIRIAGRTNQKEVVIEIADTGIGIPPECLPRIFDRFFRVDKSRSRELGGTGLGLSISKTIVERHRGQIEVESSFGKGSVFHVTLPIAHVEEKVKHEMDYQEGSQDGSGRLSVAHPQLH